MSAVNPGRIVLTGLTVLENRHALAATPNTFVYDATFSCATSSEDGTGLFRHYISGHDNEEQDGLYEVSVKIIGCRGDRNGAENANKTVNLWGDILSMQPLPSESDDDPADLDDTMRIQGAGTVSAVTKDPPAFIIHATQYVSGGTQTDDIVIRGDMSTNGKWAEPVERLPQERSVVAFYGILNRFEAHYQDSQTPTTCAVVGVEDIAYLHNPPPAPVAPSPDTKQNIREKVRSYRIQKQNETHSTSSPSTSQA